MPTLLRGNTMARGEKDIVEIIEEGYELKR